MWRTPPERIENMTRPMRFKEDTDRDYLMRIEPYVMFLEQENRRMRELIEELKKVRTSIDDVLFNFKVYREYYGKDE